MKVALYISPAHTVPPETNSILAPWWLVADIADGLVDRGHDVTLFGARGSHTKAKLVSLDIDAFDPKQKDMTQLEYQRYATFMEQRLASVMYEEAAKGTFDIIGNHLVLKTLPFTRFTHTPTVYTLHDPLAPDKVGLYRQYMDVPSIHYVSISDAQRSGADLPFAGTVYNGLDLRDYTFSKKGRGYLLAVGRIRKEKGFTDAIAVAKQLALTLVISGEYFPQYPDIAAYWERQVKPHIDGERVLYKGPMPRDEVIDLYKDATALLFPIHWEEPFGLVLIEAMACGTPVVAYNRGSVSEIVRDGVTGFIVDPPKEDQQAQSSKLKAQSEGRWIIKKRGIEGLMEAVNRIGHIDRAACRRHMEENFTVEKMVTGYESVYQRIMAV